MKFIQLAAIAITLVVALPIGVGYMMAFDETTVTGWQSVETVNLTSLILNHQSEYYGDTTSTMNNAEIIVYDGSGNASLGVPDYVVTGSTVTPIPTYETSTVTVYREMVSRDFTALGDPVVVYGSDLYNNIELYGRVSLASSTPNGWIISYGGTAGLSVPGGPGSAITFSATDSSDWLIYYDDLLGPMPLNNDLYVTSQHLSTTLHAWAYPWVDISTHTNFYTVASNTSFKIVDANGTHYTSVTEATEITRSGSSVTIGGNVYLNVTALSFASGNHLTLTSVTINPGEYADPSYGWKIPAPGSEPTEWMNSQRMKSATFYLSIPTGVSGTYTVGPNHVTIGRTDTGTTQITYGSNTYSLGEYQYLQVIFAMDSVTVSGISGWPSMGAKPTPINTKHITWDTPLTEPYSSIGLADSTEISYRVDLAVIVAGTYPSTKDYTLDMDKYWPNVSYALELSNIGIYGSSLQFAGKTYEVINGNQITIVGAGGVAKTIPILGATFSVTWADSVWTYSINNLPQYQGSEYYDLVFGGEWSCTLMGYQMEPYEQTITKWVPGEFNLSSDSFTVVGLFGCLAVFVGLGLYGIRSGMKMLSLIVICGSIALVLLVLA